MVKFEVFTYGCETCQSKGTRIISFSADPANAYISEALGGSIDVEDCVSMEDCLEGLGNAILHDLATRLQVSVDMKAALVVYGLLREAYSEDTLYVRLQQ